MPAHYRMQIALAHMPAQFVRSAFIDPVYAKLSSEAAAVHCNEIADLFDIAGRSVIARAIRIDIKERAERETVKA